MNRAILLCCFLFVLCESFAQVTFSERTQDLLGDSDLRSTITIAIDDINSDMQDDLIVLDRGRTLKTYSQNAPGLPFTELVHTNTAFGVDWSIVTGDLDNDGTPEIICSGNENGSAVLFADEGLYSVRQNTPAVYSQNSNLVDFNKDGFLDFFVCNDDGANRTYMNSGTGALTYEKIIDFQTSEEDDQSGNYSSVFTDIDSDGDLDLYIGKCRAGVSDPTDRRRVNTLYINDGEGGYQERAEEYGLAIGAQTWSVDAGDIDNDGDMDLIVANHDRTHDLMINRGGYFTRFEGFPAEAESFAYQSFFADFDNNGWLDIFITEPQHSYILYNQAMSFSLHELKVGGKRAFTGAVGDLNADGYLDLYLGFAETFQNVGQRRDAVMINDGSNNKYVGISLIGIESNRDAIGAKASVYTQDGVFTREVTAGQSYGIMNSTNQIIGVGGATAIDSIVVVWPSGNTTAIYDLEVDRRYIMEESGCHSVLFDLPNLQLCDEDGIDVESTVELESYLWSTGDTVSSIRIEEEGAYSLTGMIDGCQVWSNIFSVSQEEAYDPEAIIISDQTVGCSGEVINLSSRSGVSYLWSTGETTQAIKVGDDSESYQVTVTTNCDSYESSPLTVYHVDRDEPIITEDTVDLGGVAELSLSGDDVSWYGRVLDREAIGFGGDFMFGPIEKDTTFFAESNLDGRINEATLMSIVPLNGALQSQFSKNDTLPFTVIRPIYLESISVRTQLPGIRSIEIWQQERIVRKLEINLEQGVTKVPLDLMLVGGRYSITTNSLVNMQNLGTESPQLSYSQQFFGADKRVVNFLSIGVSKVYNDGLTPYFFAWEVDYDMYQCAERYPVTAYLDDDVGLAENEVSELSIFPNPSSGTIQIKGLSVSKAVIRILSVTGRLMMQEEVSVGSPVELSSLKDGAYIIQIIEKDRVVHNVVHLLNRE